MSEEFREPIVTTDVDVLLVVKYLLQLDAARPDSDVTPLKLQKLLYLAQAHYLAATGQRMFDEPIEAFEHGPVVHRAWQHYPGNQIIVVTSGSAAAFAPDETLPEDVESFLDDVWRHYSHCSASELRSLTHRQDPWMDHYVDGQYRAVIPDAEIAQYFRTKLAIWQHVYHPSITIVPEGFVESLDDDEFADKFKAFIGS